MECNRHSRPLFVVNMRAASGECDWPELLRSDEVREQTLLGHARGRAPEDEDGSMSDAGELSDGCGVQWRGGRFSVSDAVARYLHHLRHANYPRFNHVHHRTLRSPVSLASSCLMQDIRWQGYHLAPTAAWILRSALLNWRWAAHLLFLRASHRFVGAS